MRWLAASLVVIVLLIVALVGLLRSSGFSDREPFGLRWPAAETKPSPLVVDLPTALERLHTDLLGAKFTLLSCSHILDDASARLLDSRVLAKADLSLSTKVSSELFELRLLARLRMQEFGPELIKFPLCQTALRKFFNRVQVFADTAAEKQAGLPEADDDGRPGILQGAAPYLSRNPEFDRVQLKSGDVLLSRGITFLTTVAARLYGPESTLSHVEVVRVDEHAGLSWGISQTVGRGILARPLSDYMSVPKVRVLVLRPNDAVLARATAEWMFKKARTGAGVAPDLSYDFDLMRDAYLQISNGTFKVPLVSSHLSTKGSELLQNFGLSPESAFAPEDLETDPRFILVGEWRDLGLTPQSRMRDAVLTSMLEWMDQQHYSFKEVPADGFKQVLAAHLPNWPIISSLLKSDLPSGLDSKAASALKAFDETGEVLFSHLDEVSDQVKDKLGRWPTPAEMLEELERYRRDDYKIYGQYQKTHDYDPLARKPDFHLLFRP